MQQRKINIWSLDSAVFVLFGNIFGCVALGEEAAGTCPPKCLNVNYPQVC